MAEPWDPEVYKFGHIAPGAGNGFISCAVKKNTLPAELYFREDSGSGEWESEPVFVWWLFDANSKICHVHYDGVYVWVTNGIDVIRKSLKYGAAGTWEAA